MKKLLILSIPLLFALACTLDSVISLPYTDKVNPELLGTWVDTTETGEAELIISQHGPKEYKIVTEGDEFIAHTAKVGDINYIDINEKDERIHMFFKYDLKDGMITFYEVSDEYKDVEFKSTQLLLKYLTEHADKKDFFAKPETLMKKKKE